MSVQGEGGDGARARTGLVSLSFLRVCEKPLSLHKYVQGSKHTRHTPGPDGTSLFGPFISGVRRRCTGFRLMNGIYRNGTLRGPGYSPGDGTVAGGPGSEGATDCLLVFSPAAHIQIWSIISSRSGTNSLGSSADDPKQLRPFRSAGSHQQPFSTGSK